MTDNKKYPPLQAHKHSLNSGSFDPLYTADQMRAYVDADRAMRAAPTSHERDEAINILVRFAEGLTTHNYNGACPSDESPKSRDPQCMVCWAIDAALASAAQPSDVAWDKVLRADRPEWSNLYDRADALDDVRERMAVLEKPASAQFRPGC